MGLETAGSIDSGELRQSPYEADNASIEMRNEAVPAPTDADTHRPSLGDFVAEAHEGAALSERIMEDEERLKEIRASLDSDGGDPDEEIAVEHEGDIAPIAEEGFDRPLTPEEEKLIRDRKRAIAYEKAFESGIAGALAEKEGRGLIRRAFDAVLEWLQITGGMNLQAITREAYIAALLTVPENAPITDEERGEFILNGYGVEGLEHDAEEAPSPESAEGSPEAIRSLTANAEALMPLLTVEEAKRNIAILSRNMPGEEPSPEKP